jgi:DNA modification methylase
LKITNWDTSKIKPYENNPRINDDAVEKVARSLQEFGFRQPLVVDADGVLIVGHTRLRAAESIGIKKVPVLVADDLTADQINAYRIADNKTAEFAEWDMGALDTELQNIDMDMDWLEFDLTELVEEVQGETDEDAVPDAPEVPVSMLGEIYQLGDHRLMCGDSTSIEDAEELMGGELADMVFTDPPYGVSYEGGHNKKKRSGIISDELQGDDLGCLFSDSINTACAISKETSPFYIWYADGKSIETYNGLSKTPLEIRAVICWYKVKSGLGAFMAQYIPNYEPCIYAFKSGNTIPWFGASDEKTVWEVQRNGSNDFHPTQKPVELPERAINNSSQVGNIVLDLFGGSGSTLIACEKTNRKCRMMELDPKYCDVIRKRWAEFVHGEGCDWQKLTSGV